MGFELRGYLGRTSALRAWKQRLPSVVVCELSGEVALVPLSAALCQDLRAIANANVTELRKAMDRWIEEASRTDPVAYLDIGEFGSQSHEQLTLWAGGKQVMKEARLVPVLDYFREEAGIDLGNASIELLLEGERGEDAAERWAKRK